MTLDTSSKKEVTLFGKEPDYINEFSRSLLEGFYLREGESIDEALARAAKAYSFGDYELAQRIYEAAHKGWFMFASPILSNASSGEWGEIDPEDWSNGTNLTEKYWRGEKSHSLPISCFALYVEDTINGQIEALSELAALSVSGGGVGLHNGIRATKGKAPGPIPYMKTVDAAIGYFRQGDTRRGSCAWYMDISHPDIVEHIKFRNPTGGDAMRKSDNRSQFHIGVNVTDDFIQAVEENADFDLVCPHSGEVRETLKARYLWELLLETRALTGEPYLFKVDTANRALPQSQKDLGLKINASNICSEITLPTNEERTFVCCLSSLNLEKYDEWKATTLVADLTRFLDNVIQSFIDLAGDKIERAKRSAEAERAIGIGTMGWHYYLQSKLLTFESGGFGSAIQDTHIIFKGIKSQAVAESERLAVERGEPSDMTGTGRRNSHLLALAPNSNNSVILGTSPSIEPINGNAYNHSTRAGSHLVKNPYLERIMKLYADTYDRDDKWMSDQWREILLADGSVQGLDWLSEDIKKVFLTAFEIDQHWVIEQADARQQYVCQSQSLNLFFPEGTSAEYYNSVHLKAMRAEFVKGLYYSRMESIAHSDRVRVIERQALEDWKGDECVACEG